MINDNDNNTHNTKDDYSPGPQCYQRFELMGEGSLAGPRLRYREARGLGRAVSY